MVKQNFLVAGLITFVVFTSGMLVQWNLDQARTENLLESIGDLRLTTNSVLAEKELISTFKEDECLAYNERATKIADDVTRLGKTLERYSNRGVFLENEYRILKHEYHILEIFYWTRLVQLKETCADKNFITILYFYRYNDICPECEDQGVILTDVKKQYVEKAQIFSLDTNMQYTEPTVRFLVQRYNVTTTPVIVIDKNLKFEGLTPKETIEFAINSLLKE